MAKSKIDKDDIKRLVENTSNPTSTTSVYSAKYVDDNFLKEITKEAIEEVLTGDITSHSHTDNDTKNTAGATDTSSKIYLVGSTAQSANPQTYTHDTAYVDIDGSVYSGSSKTITNSDLTTNQIVSPILTSTWIVLNYAGTTVTSPTNPFGQVLSGTDIILEYGFKPSSSVVGKWISQTPTYDDPTSCSGLCGPTLPTSNVNTNAIIVTLYNTTTYSNTITPTTYSSNWTLSTPKKGITVSGTSLVLPIGNITSSDYLSVTYQLPIYYGNIGSSAITETLVESLTKTWKNYQSSSKTNSLLINSLDTDYWIYAWPTAWGSLTNINNADGDWLAAFTTSNTINITGASGLTISYNYCKTVNMGAFKNKTLNFS